MSIDDNDILSTLPDDILLQILLKLPAEALIQLISVSKQFKSLICNPEFVEAHLSSFETHPKHLLSCSPEQALVQNSHNCSRSNYSWNFIEHPLKCKWHTIWHVGTARGVVCLGNGNPFDANLTLWNPSIQKSITVLPKSVDTNSCCAFLCYGFGFDHVNVDFKVVRLSYNLPPNTDAMVYGVKSGHWKIVATNVPCYLSEFSLYHSQPASVCVNGVVYWPARHNSKLSYCIMGFDLVYEAFKVVELPTGLTTDVFSATNKYDRKLSTSSDGKSLVLFFVCPRDPVNGQEPTNSRNWSVWYLGKDSKWEKRYNSVADDLFMPPLSIVKDEFALVYVRWKHKLVLIDTKEGEVDLSTAMESKKWHRWFISESFIHIDYTPSLAFLLS